MKQETSKNPGTIVGLVKKLVFQNLETSFCIAIINVANQKNDFVIKGTMPGILVGQTISVAGKWINHQKFGVQLDVTSFEFALPNEEEAIEKYLASGFIRGIGPALAARLVKNFGKQTLEILEKHPERIIHVEGIGKAKAKSIVEAWVSQREISRIMLFLRGKDIPVWLANKIYQKYGDQSLHKITTDPYALADEMTGVGFKTADQLAVKLGLDQKDPKRLASALICALKEAMQSGDLYLEFDELVDKSLEMLNFDTGSRELMVQRLGTLIEEKKIVLFLHEEKTIVCLPLALGVERSIADRIKKLTETTSAIKFDCKAIFDTLTTSPEKLGFYKDFIFSKEQKTAILTALQNKVCVITGGPGTGKTTLLRAVCGVLKGNHVKFKIATPTGRAAKRVTESTHFHATTMHRLLEFDPTIGKFKRNEELTIDVDFIIVDEASMIDVFLALGLLKALKHGAHLIFLGDVDQLPSVGPGKFLSDLIESNKVSTVWLKNIFRQAAGSAIVLAAHAVNEGRMPEISTKPHSDFLFLKEDEPETMSAVLTKIVQEVLPKYAIEPSNWIVLSPMHRGSAGCAALNACLQNLLNPKTEHSLCVQHFSQEFRVDDRVMQIKNNYDKNVFNGDIGRVAAIDAANKALAINYGQNQVLYKNFELDQLTLAYAVSIHKSQGSEFGAITIPIFTQHFVMLSKKLLYTAITRAKKLCILVGQPKALAIAIKNQKSVKRMSFLADILAEKLTF